MKDNYIPKRAKIYVAGHTGLVGSAVVRKLKGLGYENLVVRTSQELDLRKGNDVDRFFEREKPEYVFLCAAKVGGIMANKSYPAFFIYENLAIQNNVIQAAMQGNVSRLLFLGSSCIYPRECPQPIKEEYLLSGALEPTNRPYAVAKIAGIEMCWAYNRQYGTQFLCAMPTNLYGPGDSDDLQNSHVLPAILRKMREAKQGGQESITLWGSGNVRREFLHSDDLAEAVVMLMNLPEREYRALLKGEEGPPLVNVGCGEDLTIRELAGIIADIVGYAGGIRWDDSKPDGTPRKLLDISRLRGLGWKPRISLREGIEALVEC